MDNLKQQLIELATAWKGFDQPKDNKIMGSVDCAEDLLSLLETYFTQHPEGGDGR